MKKIREKLEYFNHYPKKYNPMTVATPSKDKEKKNPSSRMAKPMYDRGSK